MRKLERPIAAVQVLVAIAFLLTCSIQAQAVYDIQIDHSFYGNLDQHSVPTIGNYACGPTSATNSFVYFQNKYSYLFDNDLVTKQNNDLNHDGKVDFYDDMIATTQVLATNDYMRTVSRMYTYHDDFIWAKRKYIEEKAPGQTAYRAQDYWSWTNSQRPKPSFVDRMTPTWNFLYTELTKDAALEVLLTWSSGGHFVTLTGFHWADQNSDGVMQKAENAWIGLMDPFTGSWRQAKIWHDALTETVYTDYVSGAWISMAASAVPVPEPSALFALASGLAALICRSRKKLVRQG